MSNSQNYYKSLDELSFSDLYVEDEEILYPNIKRAATAFISRFYKRKSKFDNTGSEKDDDSYWHPSTNTPTINIYH